MCSHDESRPMTLNEYVDTLRRHWLLIIVVTLLAGLAAYGLARTLPKQYQSTASVLVIATTATNTSEVAQGSNYAQNVVQSYALLATSPKVLDPVIRKLELGTTAGELAKVVDAQAPLNTAVINISTQDPDPDQAQRISTAVADSLASAVAELAPRISGKPAITVELIAPAPLPSIPVSPNTRLYLILGGLLGLALSVLFALLRRLMNARINTADDVHDLTGLPVLGEVPMTTRHETVPASALASPSGVVSEALRSIFASLRFIGVDRELKVILVTSSDAGEGKTSVSLGLGLVLAEGGNKVLVVDGDLRRSGIAKLTQLESSMGLTNVLIGDCTIEEAAQPWGVESLHVLGRGVEAPNPGQLVSSGRLGGVINGCRSAYDYVVIDSPPVLSVSDPLWLAPLTDGVVVVGRIGRVSPKELRQTVTSISATKAEVLGVILNGVRTRPKSPYLQQREPESVPATTAEAVSGSAPGDLHDTPTTADDQAREPESDPATTEPGPKDPQNKPAPPNHQPRQPQSVVIANTNVVAVPASSPSTVVLRQAKRPRRA